ncbi:PREDICTED: sodium/hydrogen exchanger 9B1 isoform X1 [Condylura cristata]|uniref:sodium/hydrogen exchanger 9B1 isoform X1 n=1 Tax=Condylura cristata TaxID=143302 RepID=UPI000642B26B|nr:PREDICTED: sodium/hydrogen exchanger 9B1 isoform X1 [Condylura cristata]XP_012583361.1 PREDICTED: sodium/hydrogen exchanger 9B1 isoform X1 [Condylura cristata]XP_012583362.1 PREDICTED: sodium/hydrogen exchanger 9B1 isoform X1 [Condylura cristata]XP_012583363.1 PREDICTED: sodium/hydrogen exchanger 9B1 isoform X1 [Condylura cristata]XP_012583364.1 PREDICTED: sodium/hydrogen exchanger 9B1 isoform X1 [Condylura cristata]
MYTIEPENEHLEDENAQSPTSHQMGSQVRESGSSRPQASPATEALYVPQDRLEARTSGLSRQDHLKAGPSGLSHQDRLEPRPSGLSHQDRLEPRPSGLSHQDRLEPRPSSLRGQDHLEPRPSRFKGQDRLEPLPSSFRGQDHLEPPPPGFSPQEHQENKPPLKKKDPRSEKKRRRVEKKGLCPPRGPLNNFITNGVILMMGWCMTWSLFGPIVLPGGSLFGFFVVFYGAFIGGKLLELIAIPAVPPLPPLLGMLLAGFTIRNAPFLSKFVLINSKWSSALRNTALTIILIRAGLGLDPKALREMKGVCLRLSIGPCLMEACTTAVIAHFLMNFPWQWGLLLGFVVGAVSPAIVVPSMLLLQERGYGIKKGIPTVLIAASSVDDIVAITGFNTCYSIVFSSGGVLRNLLLSLRDILIGVLIGAVMGIFLRYFPSRHQTDLAVKRAFLVLSMCVSAVLGSHRTGLHAAGGLCTLMLTFSSGVSWSKEKVKVQTIIAKTWNVFQPLLFGLVGWEVSVASLRSNAIGICAASITLALLVRISFTFAISSFAGFNFKEKIFIALAWVPKATVQAVLGPLALETARASAPNLELYSQHVMTVAFLAILITAPNGALFIGILGPKLLTHHDPSLVKTDWSGSTFH